MKSLAKLRIQLAAGLFEFTRHAFRRAVERNIGDGKTMFKCEVCGASKAYEEFVDEIFHIEGKHVLVEHIPAMVCDRCGEQTFSRETTERMRKMLHGEAKPVRSLDLDVFAY